MTLAIRLSDRVGRCKPAHRERGASEAGRRRRRQPGARPVRVECGHGRPVAAGLAAIALSLAACVAQREVRYTREDGNWVRTDLPAFIHRDHPVPGSDASRTALRDCEQRVNSATRELAEGHLALLGTTPSRPKGVDADTYEAGLLFCLLNPFCWPFAPPLVRMQRDWTPEQAAARDSAAREIGQCMDDQGWIYCTWHKERSGLAMGYAREGWLCRRKRLDDPQPD